MTVAQLMEALAEYRPELFVVVGVYRDLVPLVSVKKTSDTPAVTLGLDPGGERDALDDYMNWNPPQDEDED